MEGSLESDQMENATGDDSRETSRSFLVCYEISSRRRNVIPWPEDAMRNLRAHELRTSRYIGTFAQGDHGVVYSGTTVVEDYLDQQDNLRPGKPIYVAVFLTQGRGAYIAHAVDHLATEEFTRKHPLLAYQTPEGLEGRVAMLEGIVARFLSPAVSERVAIVVDNQNLRRSLREQGLDAELEEIIEIVLSSGHQSRPTEIVNGQRQIYVYDFFRSELKAVLYDRWRQRGITFVEVPVTQEPSNFNPTDGFIIDHFLGIMSELGSAVDTVCLISGDAGFIDFLMELRRAGKKILVASFTPSQSGHKGSAARSLVQSSDRFIDLGRELRLSGRHESTKQSGREAPSVSEPTVLADDGASPPPAAQGGETAVSA